MGQKTTFVLEAKEAKAVNAFLKVVDLQNKAIDGQKKLSRQGKQTSQSLEGIGKSIMGWAAGIASVATFVRGLRNVSEETEKIKQSQKEMYDIALTNEERILKLAHLRGDVSLGNIQKIRKETEALALKTSVPFGTAASLKFYMESALGTGPAAITAAEAALKFAGPARIQPEELALIPAVIKKWEAATPKEQSELFSAVYGGTKASLADVGQYIPQLMTVQSTAKEYGFTLAQTLALLTTAIEAAGLEKSGQTLMSSMLYGTGRSKKAHEYLSGEAARKGKEWGEMGAVERYWFTAGLYEEAREKGPAAEDVFKLAVGGKGYQYFQQMFSATSRRKYEEVLPAIMEKVSSDIVDVMAEQFQRLPLAVKTRHATFAETGAATTGEKKSPFAVLSEITTETIKQADANVRGWGDIIRFGLTPEKFRMFNMAQNVLQENLLLAIKESEAGSPERNRLLRLYRQTYQPSPFSIRPDYLKDVYEATEGFELVGRKGELATDEFRKMVAREAGLAGGIGRPKHYTRGIEAYYGIAEAMEEHTKALKRNTEAIDQFVEKMTTGVTSARLGPDE